MPELPQINALAGTAAAATQLVDIAGLLDAYVAALSGP
jgi:hypothetical protein